MFTKISMNTNLSLGLLKLFACLGKFVIQEWQINIFSYYYTRYDAVYGDQNPVNMLVREGFKNSRVIFLWKFPKGGGGVDPFSIHFLKEKKRGPSKRREKHMNQSLNWNILDSLMLAPLH